MWRGHIILNASIVVPVAITVWNILPRFLTCFTICTSTGSMVNVNVLNDCAHDINAKDQAILTALSMTVQTNVIKRQLDKDMAGTMNKLVVYYEKAFHPQEKMSFKHAWTLFDKDRSGELDREELKELLLALGQQTGEAEYLKRYSGIGVDAAVKLNLVQNLIRISF